MAELRGVSGMQPPIDRTATPSYTSYTDPSMMESDADKSYSQSTLQQTSQKHLTSNDAAIMQREREITEIAQGIIELADIFKELQGMIIDQGTMLDRIDYNVERMAVDVKAADKELKVASGYQKKGTKRRIILLLILLVVGMFILLLVKPKRHSKPVDDNVPPP
jgi:syntaxin 16